MKRRGDKVGAKPRALGAHYSPRPLVDDLVEACLEPLLGEGRFCPEDPPRVLDPACGDGVFLASAATRLAAWIARERPSASGAWVARQALGAVHGVDLDAAAVRGARSALIAALHPWDAALTTEEADGQVARGNSLLGPEEAPAHLAPLDPERTFPRARPGGTFDLVVGNPPFVDAEEMTRSAPELRRTLARRYRAARGNWDLFCVFVERALTLTAPQGAVGLILPNKLLSARYAAHTRRLLAAEDVEMIRDCAGLRLFDASVYPLLIALRKRAPRGSCRVQRGTGDRRTSGFVALGRVAAESLDRLAVAGWGPLLSPERSGAPPDGGAHVRSARSRAAAGTLRLLGELGEVVGAATVAEAYALAPHIRDGAPRPGGHPLVNTGLVDPFVSRWGVRALRYLGHRYARPWVAATALEALSPRRAAQARAPKIVVAGLCRRLECVWDPGGWLAGKSTSLVLPAPTWTGDPEWALSLVALLNSQAASVAYRRQYAGLALANGYLRVGPPQLKAFSVPDPGALARDERRALARLASALTALGEEGAAESDPRVAEAWRELGARSFPLFGLAPSGE